MKQIKLMFILISLLISLFLVDATLTSDGLTPADGTTDMWGKVGGNNITFTNTFRESSLNMNITNISFFSDISGTWTADGTLDAPTLGLGSPYTWAYEYNGTSRGTYTWQFIAYSDGIYRINETINFTVSLGNITSIILDSFPIKNQGTLTITNISNDTNQVADVFPSLYTVNYATGNITFTFDAVNWSTWNNSRINISYFRNESKSITTNRSITIGTAPTVSIDVPTNAIVSKTLNQTFVNFSVLGEAPKYWCSLFTNESDAYVQRGVTAVVEASQINQTNVTITYEFAEQNNINYAVFCAETATTSSALANIWAFSSNQSLSIDDTAPTILGYTPTNESYLNETYVLAGINVTDSNIQSCSIFVNDILNVTNNSMASGILWIEGVNNITLVPDGEYKISYVCNDTAANEIILNNTIVNIDTATPTLTNIQNISYTGFIDRFNITWETNESTNGSINWGTLVTFDGGSSSSPGYSTTHGATIIYNETEQTTYVNVTSCDRAGNCNITYISLVSPKEFRSGWSEFAVYDDDTLTLGDIINGTGADYVYTWNQTDQEWLSLSDLYVGDDLHTVEFGDVYFLYSSTNETFWRSISGSGIGSNYYNFNFTEGHNFIGITDSSDDYDFSNLSLVLLQNFTNWDSENKFNWTYFSGWNLSQDTVDYYWNWSWNNETLLGRTYDIESVWIWANRNVSWNGTNITKVDWSI